MSFFDNTRKPTGLGGKLMVVMMNIGHRALADWGFRSVSVPADAAVLDCGCGGGANIAKLLKKCPNGRVSGVDYSDISVKKSLDVNRKAVEEGRCEVMRTSVSAMPFDDARFDLATAFETVYFWQDLHRCFGEVMRVLKEGGTFLICNECGGDDPGDDRWTEKIDGMKIYDDARLSAVLGQVGFCDIRVHKNKNGWLCVTAQKPVSTSAGRR
ncbi:MAG: class I SAM-dependent methyltransferase [Eubacteriales bacterium]